MSRAPAYWDEMDDSGATPVPDFDVLSQGSWEPSRRWAAPEPVVPLPRAPLRDPSSESEPYEPAPEPLPEVEAPPEPSTEEAEADEPPPRGPAFVGRLQRWSRARSTRLLAIVAFVAGAVLGGATVHEWDTQQAAEKQRNTVRLTARVAEDAASSASWTGARQPWTLRVVVTNSGPTDLRVRAARLDDRRFTSHLRTVSRGAQVRAGQDAWISLDVTHSCSTGGPTSAPRTIMLTVTPEGRPDQEIRVRLSDDTTLVVDTARQKCQSAASNLWITAELHGDPADLGTELVTPIRITQQDTSAAAVREIRTPTPGLSVVSAPLPVSFVKMQTPPTTLRWTIADCTKARVIVFAEVGISAVIQLEGGESVQMPIVLDANAVLAIVRFITRTCG
ncbi:hypothetical protein SAMN05443668_112221 [Cryptosporangium aurantiacum]|uniref:Uncharacterized protein n=1 Tax=Cryptosporangium aurantiacum TaxID=134849 RepID=A0A1M7RHS1_9ACTN|nr:hypothetical protein SAMN05443668_112221 [Cryptosporangium aurantiacum]